MALGNRSTVGVRLTLPTGVEVASYADYLDAQRAVDHLSDHKLPVEQVSIVGTDLRMVEKIIGRLTYGRVAGGGAMSGAWFGLLIGLVLWMLSPSQSFIVMAAMAMGAAFGILFAVVQFALRSRDRDFASTSQVVASRYAIVADPSVASQVRRELEQAGLGGRAAPAAGAAEHARRAPYGGAPGPVPGERPADRPADATGRRVEATAATAAPAAGEPNAAGADEAPAGGTEFGSRADEKPRFGIRLEPGQSLEDVLGPDGAEPGTTATPDTPGPPGTPGAQGTEARS